MRGQNGLYLIMIAWVYFTSSLNSSDSTCLSVNACGPSLEIGQSFFGCTIDRISKDLVVAYLSPTTLSQISFADLYLFRISYSNVHEVPLDASQHHPIFPKTSF